VVRAPFSGQVAGRPVQPGTVVGAGSPIVRLVGRGGLYFEGEIPGRAAPLIRVGTPVEVRLDAAVGGPIEGRIAAVNPSVSTVGRLLSVRVELPDGAEGIRAGMFARGTVRLRSVPNAIVVPFPSIVERGGRKVAFVVEDGKAKAVPVRILEVRGLEARVEGLPVGAQLVVKGQDALDEGTPVRIEAETDEAGAGA
ncbi:MAG: efflux RND transporter periplasmic adaptor subunit, partial [Fimbriimonadales bacterium]